MKLYKKRVAAWATLMGLAASIGTGAGYMIGTAHAEVDVQVVKVIEYVIPSSNDCLDEQNDAAKDKLSTSKTSLGDFKITAYCPCSRCCGEYANGITATGTIATEGRTIAADPSVLPYGTSVWIDDKEYVVEDCGSAIKGNKIDIFFNSHESALKYGVQNHEVFVKK